MIYFTFLWKVNLPSIRLKENWENRNSKYVIRLLIRNKLNRQETIIKQLNYFTLTFF